MCGSERVSTVGVLAVKHDVDSGGSGMLFDRYMVFPILRRMSTN